MSRVVAGQRAWVAADMAGGGRPAGFAVEPVGSARIAAARLGLIVAVSLLVPATAALAGGPRAASAAAEEKPAWSELKPPQQAALAPLQQEWPQLDPRAKRRWIELVARFPKLGPDEQARVQARMSVWAHMTPVQRREARLNFQEAKQLPPGDRKARWDAYQALPPEQKQQLAARSMAQASHPVDPLHHTGPRPDRPGRDAASVPGGGPTLPAARAIAPALIQATPGATTTLIDRRPTPPEHQRAGARLGGASETPARAASAARRRPADAATAASASGALKTPAPADAASVPGPAAAASPAR